MTGPEPLIKIQGDCSTIHNNTFYVYSPTGFAKIPLEKNKGWKKLPSPEQMVTGPACVQGGIDNIENDEDKKAFYLVGGTGSSGSSGLQRFLFSTGKWETLPSTEMKDRIGHGVGYISSTSQILVYAGNTDGSTQVSQSTYLISTNSSTFEVSSTVDQGTPALYEPIILPWSSSEVALVGGSATNPSIFIYEAADKQGWAISNTTLPNPIASSSLCALASDSGTKVLEEFKMVASPNSATSYLLSSKGKAQNPVTVIGSSEKRGLTDPYNSTFAPTVSWSDYTLAQGSNGLVVLASGKSNESLAIFNQTSNAWVNSTELFYGTGDQDVLKPSTTSTSISTSSSTATATSTTPASSTSAAAVSGTLTEHDKVILGATLGSILGFGLILLMILFILRRKKDKQLAQPGRGRGGGGDNKDRLSFQDQGIEPLTEGAYPMARSPVPLAAASVDSLAIMSGNYGEKSLKPPTNTGYGLSPQPKTSSPLSTIPSSGAMGPPTIYTDDGNVGDDTGRGNQAADRLTDEGWGKYFEDGGATNYQSNRSTISSGYTKSDYRGSAWPMTTLTPLNFGFLDEPKPLGQVFSGSPTTENGPSETGSRSLVIPESQSARISSADSISVTSDDDHDDRDDPKWQGAGQNSWLGRPTSSNYTTSFYQSSTQDLPWESSNASVAEKARQSNARRSSVIIPHDIDELPMEGPKNNTNSDMSWLNLKADR